MDGFGLCMAIGPLLRAEREKQALTQAQLARRAGTSQQHISKLEAGRVSPTTALLDRVFDALGLQLRVTVEARDADLDAGIDAATAAVDNVEANLHALRALTRSLPPDTPYLVDGQLAAALQGVPLKVRRIDLTVAESTLDAVAAWLAALPNTSRWSDNWSDFAPIDRDPRRPGALLYATPWADLQLRVLPALPPPIPIAHADRTIPVRPLPDVEQDDPQIARIARRARHLQRPPATRSPIDDYLEPSPAAA